jgi:hypothetical protein
MFLLSGLRIAVKKQADEVIYSDIRANDTEYEESEKKHEIAICWFS